ncbi:MAG: HDOD domain-containing protein [Pirellulaceae bacterium]
MSEATHETTTETEFEFDLPPFPATAAELVSALNGADSPVSRIIELIECEPKIGARVLNMANSPLYGATRSIATIGHAVVILGFKSVSNLALSAAAGETFEQGDPACAAIRQETYCQSLAIGTLARLIARTSGSCNPDECFLTGVMHDIGKLVLLGTGGTEYASIIGNDELGDTTRQELQRYGATHPGLGKTCGQRWGLPPSIIAAISSHHETIDCVTAPTSVAVVAANYAARRWQIGFDTETAVQPITQLDDYLDSLGDPDLPAKSMEQFDTIREICVA